MLNAHEISHGSSKGVVCKVWNIKSDTKTKTASENLAGSIKYIINSEKTDITLDMPDAPFHDAEGQVGRELKYVMNDVKTLDGAYVGGRLLHDVKKACAEMMLTTQFFNNGKNPSERIAQHMIISLPVAESQLSNAKNLMLFGNDVLAELFPNHQAVFAIHTNTDNLHLHAIINQTGLDGRKIKEPKHWVDEVLHPCVNKYAEKYGFTQNPVWLEHEIGYKQRFIELKMTLREAIDLAIEHSNNLYDFKAYLEKEGYQVNIGKHISLQNEDMTKAVRTKQLGSNYTPEAIAKRIQTRLDDFIMKEVASYGYEGELRDTISFTPKTMKSYKEMSKEEKKEVIHQLRLKKNPWKEYREETWQIQKTVDNINRKNRARSLIYYYSPTGNIDEAMEQIVAYKKQIAKEKKEAKANLRMYKPVIDIFKEMQEYEVRSYLYEHQGCRQYRTEFDKYRELTYRLKEGYGKDINDVAEFLEEQNDHIFYANAQLGELQSQYRMITNYAREEGISYLKSDKQTVYEAMDQWKIMHDAREHHTYTNDLFYLVSKNNNAEYIRIKTSFKNVNDKVTEVIEAALVDSKGNIVDQKSSLDGMKDFNQWLFDLSGRGFTDCSKVKELSEVRTMLKNQTAHAAAAEQVRAARDLQRKEQAFAKLDAVYANKESYSFAQAVNYGTTHGRLGNHFIVNPRDLSHVLIVNTMPEKGLVLTVLDKSNAEQERRELPAIKDKTNSGWRTMHQIQNTYGFGDKCLVFDSPEAYEAYRQHVIEAEEREQRTRKHSMGGR